MEKKETIFTGQNHNTIQNMNSEIYRDEQTQAAYGSTPQYLRKLQRSQAQVCIGGWIPAAQNTYE